MTATGNVQVSLRIVRPAPRVRGERGTPEGQRSVNLVGRLRYDLTRNAAKASHSEEQRENAKMATHCFPYTTKPAPGVSSREL
jgi:hypothetical protein